MGDFIFGIIAFILAIGMIYSFSQKTKEGDRMAYFFLGGILLLALYLALR